MTGDGSLVAEVDDVAFPELLEPVDDLPPATIITSARHVKGKLLVKGLSHDNGTIVRIRVNGKDATVISANAGVIDWEITLDAPVDGNVIAHATDQAGNVETMVHKLILVSQTRAF